MYAKQKRLSYWLCSEFGLHGNITLMNLTGQVLSSRISNK